MEMQNLSAVVLMIVATGMILGVGILTMDLFGDAVKTPTDINESVTMVALAGTTTYDEINSVTKATNTTVTCTKFNQVGACFNWTEAGVITANSSWTGSSYYFAYNYDADTATTTVTGDVTTALGTISSTWLPLIITIVVLAIIIVLVIRSFGGGARK